ncbi:MAG: hypothetical protein O3A84_08235 [Proteobacteria bacterium]|nr:hypothetical protein [Pseudomonadota bacterium]
MNESSAADIPTRIADVIQMIESSRKALDAGEQVDLRELEGMAGQLHELVARNPGTDAGIGATEMIDAFASILSGLDELEAALNGQQARSAGLSMNKP